MKFTPMQYSLLRSLLDEKIKELRAEWKTGQVNDENLYQVEDELAIAIRTSDTLEELYLNQ